MIYEVGNVKGKLQQLIVKIQRDLCQQITKMKQLGLVCLPRFL